MVFFNWATMQMAAKIVYYGPGLCGKTTNLSFIYAKTSPKSRGEMVSLETESDRTLFFDLLPLEVGNIGGFKTRLQLYTVPGQVFYNTTRKLVLKGVDGVVFCADSQRVMRDANIESLENLRINLAEIDVTLEEMPIVLQYNKRDLGNVLTLEEMDADLNPEGRYLSYESSAINGMGVFETLKAITKLTLKKLRKKMSGPQAGIGASRRPAPAKKTSVSAPSAGGSGSISAGSLAEAAEEEISAPAPPGSLLSSPFASSSPGPTSPTASPFGGAPAADPYVSSGGDSFGVPHSTEIVPPSPDVEPLDFESSDSASVQVKPPPDMVEVEEVAEVEVVEEVEETEIEFDQSPEVEEVEATPPPMKRVQVGSGADILSELENLRTSSTLRSSRKASSLDLDALLGGSSKKELKRKIAEELNSTVFREMDTIELSLIVRDASGGELHRIEPVVLTVGDAASLKSLALRFQVDLDNKS